MRIAIAQMNTRAGDFQTTCARIREASVSAQLRGTDLLVVGACALGGNMAPDVVSTSGFCLDMAGALCELDQELACPTLVPYLTDAEGEPALGVVLLGPRQEGAVAFADEPASLSAEGDAGRLRWLAAGEATLAVAFTYEDLTLLREVADDVDGVLFVSSYPFAFDDVDSAMGAALSENRYRVDARDLSAWVCGVASLGGYDHQVFCGSSFVVAPTGELVARAAAFEEALLFADVLGEVGTPEPLGVFDASLHLWEALSLSLRDYLDKGGHTDVALVLDGTLGSSVLATLAVDAVGPAHVHVLVAPTTPAGDGQDIECARELARALHVEVHECMGAKGIAEGDPVWHRGLVALELARLSRETASVALGGEDKTGLALELACGACHACELLPLGDVYRSDVLDLAHMRNTVSPIIPRHALTSYSVPQVWEAEATEVGAQTRLRRIDAVLSSHIEWVRTLTDVVSRQGERPVTERILARMRDLEDLRATMPAVLSMSTRTLADCRAPHGLAWRDRVRERDEELELSHRRDLLAHGMAGAGGNVLGLLSPDGSELGELISRMGSDLLSSVEVQAQGPGSKELSEMLSSIFGLLEDLAQSGTLMVDGGISGHAETGGMGWMSPFSEN